MKEGVYVRKSLYKMLALVLLISLIVGCSSNSGNNTTNNQPNNTSTPNTANDGQSNDPEEPKGPTEFSISFETTGDGTGYTSRVDLENEKWIEALEDLTNTEIHAKMIHRDQMGLMFAGGDIADVIGAIGTPSSASMSGSVEAGVFHPLTDLIKEHTPTLYEKIPQAAWDAVSVDGEIYGVPSYLSNPSRRGTYIRMDLLEQTGKPVPKTVEEFVDVMRAFKELGVKHPYAMREDFKYADVIFGAYDVLPYRDQFMVMGDEVVPKFFQADRMMEALTIHKQMVDEGLIPKDFASITVGDFFQNIQGGEAAMWSQNAVGLPSLATAINEAVPTAEVEIIPSPTGPDGEGGYLFYAPVLTSYYINQEVEEERAIEILKFMEWQLTEEAEMFFTFGLEGDTYTVDAQGNVNYKTPETDHEKEEEGWRSGQLWMVRDTTYTRPMLELDEKYGDKVLTAFDEILANEGRGGIGFYPELEASAKFPELGFPSQDVGPSFIIDNMVRMIYGDRPIEEWPQVLEEYRERGGDEIIKEATERYNNKDGAIELYR